MRDRRAEYEGMSESEILAAQERELAGGVPPTMFPNEAPSPHDYFGDLQFSTRFVHLGDGDAPYWGIKGMGRLPRWRGKEISVAILGPLRGEVYCGDSDLVDDVVDLSIKWGTDPQEALDLAIRGLDEAAAEEG